MKLRKVVLTMALVLFLVLMFIAVTNYAQYQILIELASQVNPEVSSNTFDALLVWMQFPLLILISVMMFYLIFADESLTRQAERSRK